MKQLKKQLYFLLLPICFIACKKYEEAPLLSSPTYIRVFNNLNSTVTLADKQNGFPPFVTFLMDPELDQNQVPTGKAGIICDFLGTRKLYNPSYAADQADDSLSGVLPNTNLPKTYPINYEYPGNAHVLTAPEINGFNLSAWAQIPSGKHRFRFVYRPQNNIPFKDLAPNLRAQTLLDTTINLEKDKVYTLEVVSTDIDRNKFSLYIRDEQFINQAFNPQKIYVGFVNISGKESVAGKNLYQLMFPENCMITYSCMASSPSLAELPAALPNYNEVYLTGLNKRMDDKLNFFELPMLPDAYFFYQNAIRQYSFQNTERAVLSPLPYFRFNFTDLNNPIRTLTLFNTEDPKQVNKQTDARDPKFLLSTNLNQVLYKNGQHHISPSVNIIELMYDRVYHMQIQRSSN